MRKNSLIKNLIKAVAALAPEGVEMEIADIADIPLYNQDLEANFPAEVQALKDKIAFADGIIIATPEYSRSIPGVLKNMLDWTSRPYGMSAWAKKIVATMGATGGTVGTAVAQSHLRQIMLSVGADVMAHPEFYLAGATQKFDAAGTLVDEDTKAHIVTLWDAFVPFLSRK